MQDSPLFVSPLRSLGEKCKQQTIHKSNSYTEKFQGLFRATLRNTFSLKNAEVP